MSDYARVAYPDYIHPATDHNRMGAIARCHGINATPPENAHVLEVGCGPGGNLLSLASIYPAATLHGLDLDPGHIQTADSAVRQVGFTNVRFEKADLTRWTPPPRPFDYIIAHGIYSWVPQEVRRSLLTLCRRCLSPGGVIYLSFNAHPGWRQKSLLRDIVSQVAKPKISPVDVVDRTREWLQVLCDTVPASTAYGLALRESMALVEQVVDPEHFYHEHLEAINQPFGFDEFCHDVAEAGLQCVAEATLSDITAEDIGCNLESLSWPAMQHRLDYLTGRTFHRCLLTNADADIRRPWSLYAGTHLALTRPIELPTGMVQSPTIHLADARNRRASISDPGVKEFLNRLSVYHPGDLAWNDLMLDQPQSLVEVRRLIEIGVIEPLMQSRKLSFALPARPLATALARRQAASGQPVATRRHEPIGLDGVARQLLARCDGSVRCNQIGSTRSGRCFERCGTASLATVNDSQTSGGAGLQLILPQRPACRERGSGGEGFVRLRTPTGLAVDIPSPPNPLSPKRGEGEPFF